MEFGMLNRGEHAEITSFVGKTVNSELSGNMIDLCPVGALTSKPFRYRARTWELSRRKSVSPHDGLGSNLIVQVKGGEVMRVLPLENEEINECWLSDRDRFSYEGLNVEERLTRPMIKQDGKWLESDWQTALEYVAHGLRNIRHEHGADAIAALATPGSTLEELALLKKLVNGIGSDNVDFRLRQSDFALTGEVAPWLGMSIAEFAELKRVFVIGSFLRKDHPLLAARLRAAVKSGAKLGILHGSDDDLLMPVAAKMITAPSQWLSALGEIMAAVSVAKTIALPAGFENVEASENAKLIAASLLSGEPRAIMLGNAAAQHPQASQLHAAAQWLAEQTGAHFGYLTEGANTVGGHIVQAYPGKGGNALQMFEQPRKAYLLLNAEPELDCYDPQAARRALDSADMVVAMSPYKHGLDYADVLLPVSPFSETAGTFVNCEGRAQSFNGTVKPLGETRPAWKVLRVIGNLLDLQGFNYETSEEIRNEVLGMPANAKEIQADLRPRLNNTAKLAAKAAGASAEGMLERLAPVPIYSTDAIVRRSPPLQQTDDAKAPLAWVSPALAEKLVVIEGDVVKVSQGSGSALMTVGIDQRLPDSVVRVAAAHPSTQTLGGMFGEIRVEKA
jgi:NADH-quinone oxidoreductase subunit G